VSQRFRRDRVANFGEIMLDIVYVGVIVLFFAAFAIYALGCEKL
jgi:hypothetical protein